MYIYLYVYIDPGVKHRLFFKGVSKTGNFGLINEIVVWIFYWILIRIRYNCTKPCSSSILSTCLAKFY